MRHASVDLVRLCHERLTLLYLYHCGLASSTAGTVHLIRGASPSFTTVLSICPLLLAFQVDRNQNILNHLIVVSFMADQGTFTCLCGRIFYQNHAYGSHQKSCKGTKKRLSSALNKASQIFAQKRQKLVHATSASTSAGTSLSAGTHCSPGTAPCMEDMNGLEACDQEVRSF